MSPANTTESEYASLTVRLSKETAERFKAICDAEYRPVATEMRRLIDERIAAGLTKEAA